MSEVREPADELITRARRVYAECASYSDEGTHSTLFEHVARPWMAKQLRFVTRWRRPDRFYFEYREVQPELVFPGWRVPPASEDAWTRHAVWANAEGAGGWWTLDSKIESGTLESAISGATGVSGGTAYNIPSLLRVIDRPPTWFPSPAGFEGEVVQLDGRECLCIPMRTAERTEQLWLERSSGLVLRFDERVEFSTQGQIDSSRGHVERMRKSIEDNPASAEQYASLLRSLEERAADAARHPPEAFTTRSSTRCNPRLDPDLREEDFVFVPPAGT